MDDRCRSLPVGESNGPGGHTQTWGQVAHWDILHLFFEQIQIQSHGGHGIDSSST